MIRVLLPILPVFWLNPILTIRACVFRGEQYVHQTLFVRNDLFLIFVPFRPSRTLNDLVRVGLRDFSHRVIAEVT
jgi:hypothetical protein